MSKESDDQLSIRVEQLKTEIRLLNDPKGIAFRCGMDFIKAKGFPGFQFSLFDSTISVNYPELDISNPKNGAVLKISSQALIFYYMIKADASPLTGKWVSFADLPNGRFYAQAFQGYTGDELASILGNDDENFSYASLKLNGKALPIGDAAFEFVALPRVPIAVVYWKGDEEFHSNCKVLFDASIGHYLPTDACAILGSILVQKLKFLVKI
jgi:hypothetical protein